MPTYHFRDKETGEEIEQFLRISELDEYKKSHPNLETIIKGVPSFSGETKDVLSRTPDGFKDLLNRVKDGAGKDNNIKVV